MNGELPLMALLNPPAPLDADRIASFGDDEGLAVSTAIRWAWIERRVKTMGMRRAAELCGMKPSHFSNMIAGRKYLPPQKINVFEEVVGNTAVSQTIARFKLLRDERLRRELAELVAQSMRVA